MTTKLAGNLLQLLQFLLILSLTDAAHETYRFKLDIGNPNELCPRPEYVCKDGSKHYLCEKPMHPLCICFNPVTLTGFLIKTFLEATNGIRNKVAIDLNIANMNLVYWSDQLSEMANKYLRLCDRKEDPCLIIGEKLITVSQNSIFYEGEISERWPGRAVRNWYYEVGKNITTFDDYVKHYKMRAMKNITNLLNPYLEFIGCGATRLSRGYYVICYYHPEYIHETFPANFILGEPCSKCAEIRSVCSRTFSNLCGVDYDWVVEHSISYTQNIYSLIFCLLFVYLL